MNIQASHIKQMKPRNLQDDYDIIKEHINFLNSYGTKLQDSTLFSNQTICYDKKTELITELEKAAGILMIEAKTKGILLNVN